jgi:hypothetical protein
MPIVIGPDHAGAIPHDEGAERRIFAADALTPQRGTGTQTLQFCLVRLSAGRSHRGMSEPSAGIVAGLARGPSAVMGEPPAGNHTSRRWGHAG